MYANKFAFFSTIFLHLLGLPTIYGRFYPNLAAPLQFITNIGNNIGNTFRNLFNVNAAESNGTNNTSSTTNPPWSYNNLGAWRINYPTCGGRRQSPIDIDFDQTANSHRAAPNLRYVGYENIPSNMSIMNNGHTIEIAGEWPEEQRPYITGGGLPGEYVFEQFHYHWGNGDPPNAGAEHTFNGRTLPLELHIVHYKRDYGSIEEAVKNEDGVAVIGRVFWVNDNQRNGFGSFKNFIGFVTQPNTERTLPPFPLSDFEFNVTDNFLTYPGSLTTPPCTEVVTWILPTTPLWVSNDVLRRFRAVRLNDGDTQNYRPVQPLDSRRILLVRYNRGIPGAYQIPKY